MDNFNATLYMLTAGLRALPTDDVARVKHFLAEYLGDRGHPVPFGGRARDFERLDNWLLAAEGPSYALLAAPAGRGKSALLLRWCQRLLTHPDLAVVYFPVSIRFRTNLAGVVFPALVALLASLHGERLPSDPHTHQDVWHSLLTEYITRALPDGRRLLLVLDGVDEAADWDAGSWLWPENPPAHLRVILSARYLANDQDASAWLTRLGWTRAGLARALELYPLDRTGIASVLIQMGFPLDLLGARVDLVAELHRLSEGDPLLIRLYVDDLWQRGDAATHLTPEDLQAIRPGLSGYFERWWHEQRSLWQHEAPQREATAQTLLNLLAGALGPLSKADLLALVSDVSLLQAGQIEQDLEPLARFVIGDGMRQGYVFSHPRLASYFLEERLSEAEHQAVEQLFLSWGARTLAALNTGELAPELASPYIVQYYGAHLERVQAEASVLCALVSDGWRRAWEKLDRAKAGFLGDSERAWHAAERTNTAALSAGQTAPYLGAEIRSLLCRVSINSMTSNLAPRLMLEAVKTGVWTPAQGLASIRLSADLTPRARELVGLAPYVQEPLRGDILQEAFDTVASLKYERDRLDALVELAPGFSTGLLEQVLETVQTLADEADKAGVLAELAPTLAAAPELLAKALDLAQAIEEEEYLVLALEGLLPYLSDDQRQHALHLARNCADERYRAQALTALVPYLPTTLLLEILAECRSMRAGIPPLRLLAKLVSALPESARAEALQDTLERLNEIIDQEYRIEILLTLAPFLPAEQLQHLLTDVQALWDESERARVLRALLPLLPAEQLPAFLETTLTIKNEEQRVAVLLRVLPLLPAPLLANVLEVVPTLWDEGLRVEMLARLAPISGVSLRPRLLELVEATSDPGYRVWLLAELESSLASTQHTLDIERNLLNTRHPDERLQTLLAIVERVSDEALTRVFVRMEPEIFGFYGLLRKTERQADIFTKLAPRMPAVWLTRMLQQVRMFEHEESQVRVLVALAPRIDENLLPRVLDIVRAMQARAKRSQVLEALVSSLPLESKAESVREMLQILQIIKDESERATLFEALTGTLTSAFPGASVPGVLAAVATMRSEIRQSYILAALARTTPPEQFEAVLQATRALWSSVERERVLSALAPHLPERSVPSFFAAVQALPEEQSRVNTLVTLAQHVSSAAWTGLLALALDIHTQQEQARILGALAAHLPESAFPQFWTAIQQIENKGSRVWILSTLATCVPAEYFAPFWQATQEITEQGWQLQIIATLARHTPASIFPQLWAAIQQHEDQRWRALAIKMLVPHTPASFYPQVFQAVFEAEVQDTDATRSSDTLETLVNAVPESFFLQFWHKVSEMRDKWQQMQLRESLAARVPASCFAEVWNTVNSVEEKPWRQDSLWEKLTTRIPERFFGQVWDALQVLDDPGLQARMLVALAPHVPESFVPQFWQTAQTVKNGQKQMQILGELLPRLPQEMLAEAVEVALALPAYVVILEALIPRLSAAQSEVFLTTLLRAQGNANRDLLESLPTMQKKWPHGWWQRVLMVLAPQLPEERLQVLLPALLPIALKDLRSDEDRTLTLMQLARRVPIGALPAMLGAIWSVRMEHGRAQVLDVLLPALAPDAWVRVLALTMEKVRATDEMHYLLQVLKSAPATLLQAAPLQLYPALHEILQMLAQRPRRAVLADLVSLAPVLQALGGADTIVATACAALEIGHWWP